MMFWQFIFPHPCPLPPPVILLFQNLLQNNTCIFTCASTQICARAHKGEPMLRRFYFIL